MERAEFSTATPDKVLGEVISWLKQQHFDCLGIASFGPIELHKESSKYGYITTTPKPGWRDVDVEVFFFCSYSLNVKISENKVSVVVIIYLSLSLSIHMFTEYLSLSYSINKCVFYCNYN